MSNRYTIAVEYQECKDNDFCIIKDKANPCEKQVKYCKHKLNLNPLCFSNDIKACSSNRIVPRKYNKKYYIFYDCGKCPNRFKGNEKKLLKSTRGSTIYFGDDLTALEKKVFKNSKPKATTSSDDEVIKYFKEIISSIRSE